MLLIIEQSFQALRKCPSCTWQGLGLPMSLRIEEGIRVTEPCSSATQLEVISEDSDLYRPFK